MEFVSKPKKAKVTIAGESYEMRMPTVGESEKLQEKIAKEDQGKALSVYAEFFDELGLPTKALKSMDMDDFLSFVEFVLSPKKKN